ncbi:MAG: tetratricopeptide repeat protein [Coleofasciculaceae cyanobacterium SM2_1_6]|nr:tetratricopeptide repeat protein [Coleofasciculaceae cyanobacterium SM2_1_6]
MLSKEPSVNLNSNLEADFLLRNAEALQKIAIFADLSEGFTLGFVEVNLERDRNFAIAALEARNNPDRQWISLQFNDPDLRYLIAAITEALAQVEIIPDQKIILLISGLEKAIGGYGDYPPLLSNLNIARDTYTHKLPYPMLFFLPSYAITRFARFAPDFWAWKSIEVRLQSDLPTPDREFAAMPQISSDQKVFPVTQERFDLLYRLLTEYPQPTLTRADLLDQLGDAYKSHSNYVKAENAYQESLNLYQKLLGDDHLTVANSLNNLAGIYRATGRYSDAEPLYQRSLHIRETQLGADHPSTASSLNNLAGLYDSMGRYSDAEPLYERALEILVKSLGENHPNTQSVMSALMMLKIQTLTGLDAATLQQRIEDNPDAIISLIQQIMPDAKEN